MTGSSVRIAHKKRSVDEDSLTRRTQPTLVVKVTIDASVP